MFPATSNWWIWVREQVLIALDAHGRVAVWNKGAEQAFGLSSSQAMGKPLSSILPAEPGARIIEAAQRSLQTSAPCDLRDLAVARGPGIRYLDVHCSPYALPDGGRGALVVGTDVTSRHRTDPIQRGLDHGRRPVAVEVKRLEPSKARPRERPRSRARDRDEEEPHVTSGGHTFLRDGVIVCDEEDVVVFWTGGVAQLFGITSANALGRRLFDLVPSLECKEIIDATRRALSGLSTAMGDLPAGPDQTLLRCVASPAGTLGKRGRGYVLVVAKAGSELPATTVEVRFDALAESAPEPTVLFDASGKVLRLNPAASAFFGPHLRPGLPVGKAFVTGPDTAMPDLVALGADAASRRSTDVRVRSAKGVRDATLVSWSLDPEDGRTLVALFLDTTERERREAEILESRDQLTVYNKILTHDVGNLLMAMYNHLHLANMAKGPQDATRHLTTVRGLVKEMEGLIQNVRILSSQPSIDPEPMDAQESLAAAFAMAAMAFPNKEFRPLQNAKQAMVKADPTLTQVFYNLLSNAARHNPRPDAFVAVEARSARIGSKKAIRWSIVDNGPGIPEEHRTPKPLHACTSRHGLGLAISHALVTRWGGSVSIEDRVAGKSKEGSAVHVTLPLVLGSAQAKASKGKRARARPRRHRRRRR